MKGHRLKKSIAQVLGNNPKYIWNVLIIIFLTSWISDLTLEILETIISEITNLYIDRSLYESESKISIEIYIKKIPTEKVFLLVSLIISLLLIFRKARRTLFSENYRIIGHDHLKKERETMIMTLSPFFARGRKDENGKPYPIDKYIEDINDERFSDENSPKEINKIDKFSSNWLPCLNALEQYKNVNRLILLSTASELEDTGSFDQIENFKKFVKTYYKKSKRNITIENHIESKLVDKKQIIKETINGISANDAEEFCKVGLNIMDNLEETEKENPSYLEEKLVVDITSGKSSMTASLAAISGRKGIFIHYTDTNDFSSHVLDISNE